MFRKKQNNQRGQTALEYALVIGVIVIGVLFAGKHFFGGKDSAAGQLMNKSIQSAEGTIIGMDKDDI